MSVGGNMNCKHENIKGYYVSGNGKNFWEEECQDCGDTVGGEV
jgi:hypothetical protein